MKRSKERDEELFEEYQRVISSHGKLAPYIAKSKLYAETAEKFFLTPDSARNIIQRMMRKNSSRHVRK